MGDWDGLGNLMPLGEDGNCAMGTMIARESNGSITWSGTNKLIALLGVENLIVVETEDAILVANRDRAQDVKYIVADLKASGRTHLT